MAKDIADLHFDACAAHWQAELDYHFPERSTASLNRGQQAGLAAVIRAFGHDFTRAITFLCKPQSWRELRKAVEVGDAVPFEEAPVTPSLTYIARHSAVAHQLCARRGVLRSDENSDEAA